MSFVVSARKYRPSKFDEVVGQRTVATTLKNAIKNDKLAQSFLFCGPRGVGKTTCARILAKVLNCQNLGENIEPCSTCEACKAFEQSASFNIFELDAASNNSVEDIRNLIEQVRFAPQSGKYKIYIIDEVHMLSQAAFNAFLKTLEEPPSYAVFILATTEKHKIIPTILSRCQIFDFSRIKINDIIEHLQFICEDQKIAAEKDALHIIAQKADGALRDALSIFDRLASFSEGKIEYQTVLDTLSVLDYDYYFKVTDSLLAQDTAGVLLLFDEIIQKGFEGDNFINGLAAHFRNLLVCKDPKTLSLLEVSEGLQRRYHEQATLSPPTFLLSSLSIINHCDVNYKMSANKRLQVELALLKMCYINNAIDLSKRPAGQRVAATPIVRTQVSAPTPIIVQAPPSTTTTPTTKATATAPTSTTTPTTTKEKPKSNNLLKRAAQKKVGGISIGKKQLADAKKQKKEEVANQQKNLMSLNAETLPKIWKGFTTTINSPLAKAVFEEYIPVLKDKVIAIKVGKSTQKGLIEDEKARFMGYLRNKIGENDYEIEIAVDKKQESTQSAIPYTPKDKFKAMTETNPKLSDLTKRLQLDLDF